MSITLHVNYGFADCTCVRYSWHSLALCALLRWRPEIINSRYFSKSRKRELTNVLDAHYVHICKWQKQLTRFCVEMNHFKYACIIDEKFYFFTPGAKCYVNINVGKALSAWVLISVSFRLRHLSVSLCPFHVLIFCDLSLLTHTAFPRKRRGKFRDKHTRHTI